jgi:hypothetical protein
MEVEVMAKRMGGLGKLSDFGKTNQPQPQVEAEVTEVSTQSQPAIESYSTAASNCRQAETGRREASHSKYQNHS